VKYFDDPEKGKTFEHPLLKFQQLRRHVGVENACFAISTIALHLLNEHGIMTANLLQVAVTSARYDSFAT
jgi:hypothetical protein